MDHRERIYISYDSTNRVPLFYEDYSGSIVDVSQLQFMLEKPKSYGYRRCGSSRIESLEGLSLRLRNKKSGS